MVSAALTRCPNPLPPSTQAGLEAMRFHVRIALGVYDFAVLTVNHRFSTDRLSNLVYYVMWDLVGHDKLTVPIRDDLLETSRPIASASALRWCLAGAKLATVSAFPQIRRSKGSTSVGIGIHSTRPLGDCTSSSPCRNSRIRSGSLRES